MGILAHDATHLEMTLPARVLVGRGPGCTLRLDDRQVSAEHASIWWTREGWRLRDLGSRNGTWLGDRRLAAGEDLVIPRGARLGFGGPSEDWALTDDSPPVAMARRLEPGGAGGPLVVAPGEVLALPDGENPEAVVFFDRRAWVVEREGRAEPVLDQALIQVGGQAWRLYLPVLLEGTLAADDSGLSLRNLRLRFAVSRNEEHVDLVVCHRRGEFSLEPRAFHYMLLTLARLRLEDAALPEEEQGWVDSERLARMLAMTRGTVNVHVCRARAQFSDLGIAGAADIVERRATSQEIRLGVRDLLIRVP